MKTVASNRRARYDYEILDTLEAGIILSGQEVKSCRAGNVHLAGSYVSLLDHVPVLKNAKIAPYAYASGLENYEPGHDRTLLLKKAELRKLDTALNEKGVSLIPLEMKAGRRITIVLGLGKGKKRHDKRAKIKERDVKKRLKKGEEV